MSRATDCCTRSCWLASIVLDNDPLARLTHALVEAAGMTRNGDPSTKPFSGLERSKANR